MATWTAPLPPNDVVAGDPGHPEMHNELVDAIVEARDNVDVAETTAAWATVTGKPSTFPPTIGTTATTAVAGNDARLTAGAAGTATVRALGTTATTAAAGDHTHAWAAISGKPTTFPPTIDATATGAVAGNDARLTAGAAGTATVRAIGTTATTAAAGNHTHAGLLAGTASAIADSTATDVAGLVADFNALLAVLRTRGVLSA